MSTNRSEDSTTIVTGSFAGASQTNFTRQWDQVLQQRTAVQASSITAPDWGFDDTPAAPDKVLSAEVLQLLVICQSISNTAVCQILTYARELKQNIETHEPLMQPANRPRIVR